MKKETIAINALSALRGGGQVYISNILRYAENFPDIKVYVLTPPKFAHLYRFHEVDVISCEAPSNGILRRLAWERWRMPRLLEELKIDLVFCPGGTITFQPPQGCKTAVTFQNMLVFDKYNRRKYPIGYRRLRLSLLERISRKTFKQADLIIFLSEHAKKLIDDKVPDRKGLSVLIPHGLDDRFRTGQRNDIPRCKLLPDGEYLLYVSVINTFKAQIEVVRAYHILCQRRYTKEKLLLVGSSYPKYEKLLRKEVRKLKLQDKVIITGQLPYSDMPSVYHHAKAHIFASTCENCPNVVLESLGSGRPVFLSNRPPMPELAGDAGVYFDPYNLTELADMLVRHLDDEEWMKHMSQKTFERSLLYSWKTTSLRTFQAIKSAREELAV